MKHLTHWFAALTGTAALSAFALAGCSGDDNNNSQPAVDASTDTTTDTSVADAAHDGGTDVSVDAAPCPVDANILAPVDAAADPTTAACQACLADAASMVPSVSGSGTCIANLEACSEDCTCTESVVEIAACLNGGNTSAYCLLNLPGNALTTNVPFKALIGCQGGPCRAACTGGSTTDAGDAGSDAATVVDGSSDSGADASAADASAADASTADATTDGGAEDAAADAAADGSASDATSD
jgi:hypothetical protein